MTNPQNQEVFLLDVKDKFFPDFRSRSCQMLRMLCGFFFFFLRL